MFRACEIGLPIRAGDDTHRDIEVPGRAGVNQEKMEYERK